LATNDGFPKDAQKYSDCAQKKRIEACIPNVPPISLPTFIKNLSLVLVPAFKATNSLNPDAMRYCQECVGCFTIFHNEIETGTLWADVVIKMNATPIESFEAWREIKDKPLKVEPG